MGASHHLITDILSGGWRELRERPKGQVPALDALRAFAILLVVFHHWSIREYVAAGGVATPLQNFPVFWYGWAGVDLFFVLSGYLIGKQLWRELDRTGTIRFGRFVLRRGLRIWPIYFATLVFYALTSRIIHPRLADWVFLSNYIPGGFGRGWSLSTEEQFYLTIPALLILIRRRIPLLGYLWVLLGIEALVLSNRYFMLERVLGSGMDYQQASYVTVYPFHQHLEGLLAGLIISLLMQARPAHFAVPKSRFGVSWRGLGVFVGATAVALALRSTIDHLFAFVALGLIFGGATYFALLDQSLLTRWLHAHFWYPISRLSYSMYLNHWWMLPSANGFLVRQVRHVTDSPPAVFLITMVLGTLISVALAAVMFLVIEHPFLVLRDRVLGSSARKARAPVPAPPEAAVPPSAELSAPGNSTVEVLTKRATPG